MDGWMDDSSHTGDILRSTFVAYQNRGRERKYQNEIADRYYLTLLFIQCMLNVNTMYDINQVLDWYFGVPLSKSM
jgi:hypothetical protein